MILSLIASLVIPQSVAGASVWEIGKIDGSPRELGLAPGSYAAYGPDPVFTVGVSKASDWAYVLPGPNDEWGRNRAHAGEVYFGLRGVTASSVGHLTLALSDSHSSAPPHLTLLVNGKKLADWQTPRGKSDAVIEGSAATGTTSWWTVDIPGSALRDGNNVVTVQNDRGSWAVYDGLKFEIEGGPTLAPVSPELHLQFLPASQAIFRTKQGPRQPVSLEIANVGGPVAATAKVDGIPDLLLNLASGRQRIEIPIPPTKKPKKISVRVSTKDTTLGGTVVLEPVRPWTIYLFPHSHVDIGYTDLQTHIEKLHRRNLFDAIEIAKESAGNPKDSQFRFNVESTWVLDRFWQHSTAEEKAAVLKALREKTLSVSGGYSNLLTGVMQPEELMRSFQFSRRMQDITGVKFDTVSQSDVPGITWGVVTALHEAGIRNLVLMPNAGDRIGGVRNAWEDKPFFWVGPSGREKVLVWETDPYSWGVGAGWDGNRDKIYRSDHPTRRFIQDLVFPKLNRLLAAGYPYDIVAEPWSFVDNAPVDGDVPAAAKAWNEKYVTPRVVLSTWSEACEALRSRYAKQIPVVKGDLTPYWEDGVGSSAAETSMNRRSPDRLLQAEALYAMGRSDAFPAEAFREAWRNVLLYSEHTWGAWNSISDPDDAGVSGQWAIKQKFALDADRQSRALLARSLAERGAGPFLSVSNTTSWTRTDLIRLSAEMSKAGDRVEDEKGVALPSQRLSTGELAVLVRDVPAFAAKRIRVVAGAAFADCGVTASEHSLKGSTYEVNLDPATGAVASLRDLRLGKELVEAGAAHKLNQFLYLPGVDLTNLQRNRRPMFEIVETGPLVATVRVTSAAPGAKGLRQEISLVAGLDRVELNNTIDKLPVRPKEGVHFAYPFTVPGAQMRIDLPWSQIRPDEDQMAGANKNWLTSQGFVDVSNSDYGVTWVSLDAPLIEVGEISANLLGSQWAEGLWRKKIGPTQTLYSWALNNHWHTNYRADQEGMLSFRYLVRGHGAFASDEASRFGMAARQPLVVSEAAMPATSLLTVSDPAVLVTSLRPSDDGKALIVRLWGATAKDRRVRLRWRSGLRPVTRTDLTEKPGAAVGDEVVVPGRGVVTLRVSVLGR